MLSTSIFKVKLTFAVLMIKVRFYLLYFIAYFAILIMLMFLVERLNVGKKSINLMLKSALTSKVYKAALSTVDEYDVYGSSNRNTRPLAIERLKAKTEDLRKKAEAASATDGATPDASGDVEANVNPLNTSIRKVTGESDLSDSSHVAFIDYLNQDRKFIGCGDVVYDKGCKVPFSSSTLQPGLAEDFLLNVCNNHSFFSGIFCAKGIATY